MTSDEVRAIVHEALADWPAFAAWRAERDRAKQQAEAAEQRRLNTESLFAWQERHSVGGLGPVELGQQTGEWVYPTGARDARGYRTEPPVNDVIRLRVIVEYWSAKIARIETEVKKLEHAATGQSTYHFPNDSRSLFAGCGVEIPYAARSCDEPLAALAKVRAVFQTQAAAARQKLAEAEKGPDHTGGFPVSELPFNHPSVIARKQKEAQATA